MAVIREQLCWVARKDDAAVAPSCLPYVVPQQDDWPEELLGLTEAEAESLQIIRLDATFRTVQGGKSPVTSRKKTQVIKARWQRTDIEAGSADSCSTCCVPLAHGA